MFGYIKEISTDRVLGYWDHPAKPEDTSELEYIECLESEKPDFYQPLRYNSDTLISWALQQNFAASIMAHMAAFLDFSNKATEVSKTNFLAYATAVNLVDTANLIINQAIKLGADISASA